MTVYLQSKDLIDIVDALATLLNASILQDLASYLIEISSDSVESAFNCA